MNSSSHTSARSRLRTALQEPVLVVAPGAYDGITARAIELAGFGCAYMSGAGVSASRGFPDLGLLTLTEMAQAGADMAASVKIPVIADADTGYGNELNVTRTIREYERAGLAGCHIEDQVAPKRCGHLEGKEVVDRVDFVAKIRAAVAARRDPEFIIIGRTDARAVTSLDEAVTRANLALEAGADRAFVEAPQDREEVRLVPRLVAGPCLLNIVHRGRTPPIMATEAQEMGYRMAILPSVLMVAVLDACDATLKSLSETGHPLDVGGALTVSERFRRYGSDEWNAMRTRFRSPPAQETSRP